MTGRVALATRCRAYGWSFREPFTQPYTSESHTTTRWNLDGSFSTSIVRDAWGNITRHSPNISDFLRNDHAGSSSTTTDATGTTTSDTSYDVTTADNGPGGLDQDWTTSSSWSHTPAPPTGGVQFETELL